MYNSDSHAAEGKAMYPCPPEEATPIAYGLNVYGGNRIWSIGAKTEYPELCMAILNWLSTPEGRMTSESVSYTHLDVYKRQAMHQASNEDYDIRSFIQGAVSYTHLDVYKRQVLRLQNTQPKDRRIYTVLTGILAEQQPWQSIGTQRAGEGRESPGGPEPTYAGPQSIFFEVVFKCDVNIKFYLR